MTANASQTIYSMDTSAFMDWQARFYPTDVFVSVSERIDELIVAERLTAPILVEEELGAVGTTELVSWAKERSGIFVPLEMVLEEALSIQSRFPGLKDPKSEYEEADAYVIALAKLQDGVVVTQETPASEKRGSKGSHYIPDVCRELGLPCINLLGLMRRERWRF